jgi:hypothetical protein
LDCLFAHYDVLHGSCLERDWEFAPITLANTTTLPPGEEQLILTHRYKYGLLLHTESIPSRFFGERPLSGINGLLISFLTKILKRVCTIEGAIETTISRRGCKRFGRFWKASVRMASTHWASGYIEAENILQPKAIQNIMGTRLVSRKWAEIDNEEFLSNVFIFFWSQAGQRGNHPTEWHFSCGAYVDRFQLRTMDIRYRIQLGKRE